MVEKGKPYSHLITWDKINANFPWNIILLSGGGIALAAGFNVIYCNIFILFKKYIIHKNLNLILYIEIKAFRFNWGIFTKHNACKKRAGIGNYDIVYTFMHRSNLKQNNRQGEN